MGESKPSDSLRIIIFVSREFYLLSYCTVRNAQSGQNGRGKQDDTGRAPDIEMDEFPRDYIYYVSQDKIICRVWNVTSQFMGRIKIMVGLLSRVRIVFLHSFSDVTRTWYRQIYWANLFYYGMYSRAKERFLRACVEFRSENEFSL